ncbi:glycoside hydrolase family 140 protein [Runella aurantiaca]|uniref:glycoside hydrolase family 140 protein n=1 Tax=Runella aurantiaca TaxID=2282308 RepID=UPI0018F61B43|nr:glycoside hydrolase family 140 protein [Runella aurantiaca]
MMRSLTLWMVFLLLSISFLRAQPAPKQAQWSKLYIMPDKRTITRGDGKPFFWLGDTAWELFHRLTKEETDFYLKRRAEQGFTVIQAVALAEFDGLTQPNQYGQLPLKNNDPTKPNELYFQHVDYVINKAASLGLVTGLLPTWGDKFNKKWGIGPEVFTPENARIYGEWLGRRYKGKPVIWILGGDRSPETEQHYAIIRAMAEGVRAGNGGTQLMTYHPVGNSNSAAFFHKDNWLNFNMYQSGHSARNAKNYVMQRQNYQLFPVKPTLDGEPRYEDHPINWKPELDYFNAHDARQAAWWAMLAGGCGHTYGNHNVWQFFDPNRNKSVSVARTHWRRAVDSEGAWQMGYLRKLYESHPWNQLIPEQSLLKGDNPDDASYQMAAWGENKDFVFAYTPTGKPLKIDLAKLQAPQLMAYWFNPRDGVTTLIGDYKNDGVKEFKTPVSCPTCDWVLVIDDVTKPWAGVGLSKIMKK